MKTGHIDGDFISFWEEREEIRMTDYGLSDFSHISGAAGSRFAVVPPKTVGLRDAKLGSAGSETGLRRKKISRFFCWFHVNVQRFLHLMN